MSFAILDPTFGEFIVDNADWQWIYLVNIPVVIISISMIHANIEEIENREKVIMTFIPVCFSHICNN